MDTQTTTTTTQTTFPEAPASINTFIERDGLRYQVTGRGTTAAEAVAQVRALIAELDGPAAVAVVTQPTVAEQVGALLAKGLACAAKHNDPALAGRVSSAAWLVLSGAVEPTDCTAVLAVRSQAHPESWYEVTGQVCTCKAWEYSAKAGKPTPCKHVLAAEMYKRLA